MAFRFVALAALAGRVASAAKCKDASPMLQMVENIPSKCLDACPQMCKPLDSFIAQFMQSNDVPKNMICKAKKELDCAFEADNLEECKKLFSAASAAGIKLPADGRAWEEYTQECSSEKPASQPSKPFLASTAAPKAICKGDNDMVEMAKALAPDCFTDSVCPGLCAAMEPLAEQFKANGDRDALEKQICAAQDVFRCVLKPANKAACGLVVQAGAEFNVPESEEDLRERCNSLAHDAQPKAEPASNAASRFGFPMEFAVSLLLVGAWQHMTV